MKNLPKCQSSLFLDFGNTSSLLLSDKQNRTDDWQCCFHHQKFTHNITVENTWKCMLFLVRCNYSRVFVFHVCLQKWKQLSLIIYLSTRPKSIMARRFSLFLCLSVSLSLSKCCVLTLSLNFFNNKTSILTWLPPTLGWVDLGRWYTKPIE